MYIILYLLQDGQLSWFKEKDINKIVLLKEQLTTINTHSYSPFMNCMLAKIRNLAFREAPNYGELINILEMELLKT
jgi:hypothetical protein